MSKFCKSNVGIEKKFRRRPVLWATTSVLVPVGIMFGMADMAAAGCTPSGNTINCSGAVPGVTTFMNLNATTTVQADLATPFSITNGRFRAETSAGNISFTGNNVTVTNGDGTVGATASNGVIHVNNTGTGNATLTLSNSTITTVVMPSDTSYGTQGLTAQINPQNGTGGTATVATTNVDVNMASVYSRAGLNANAQGTNSNSNAIISMTGGSVTTAGAMLDGSTGGLLYHAALRANSSNGDASVTVIQGDTSIATNQRGMILSKGSAAGISATTSGTNGKATVVSNGVSISTQGNAAQGIYASTVNGSISITNSALISTLGTTANGIIANPSGAAPITITNTGIISTAGDNANGIKAGTSANGTIEINSYGNITTGGVGAYGIYTQAVNGITTITNTADVKTTNIGNYVHGIYAQTTGTGDATITNTGNVTISGSGTALREDLSGGNATINQNSGNLIANGNLANGVAYAATSGTGNSVINMNGGTVVNNSTGASGHGLEAQVTGNGSTEVHLNAGSVTTYGGNAIAAWYNNTGSNTGNATVTTSAGTVIKALGSTSSAEGIYAMAGNSVNIDSQSSITANAVGIIGVSKNSGTVTIKQTGGDITSGAYGIQGKSAGKIDITNSGIIQTSSAGGFGIFANGTGSGDALISNAGNVTTSGVGADGINAQTQAGAITVGNTSAINTIDGAGILALSASGVLNLTNSGALTTGGRGIYGETGGGASVTIANSGNIVTSGSNSAVGILGISNGNVSITSNGADITTNGGGASNHGIEAKSLNGLAKVSMSNGTVSVAGQSVGLAAWNSSSGLSSSAEVYASNAIVDATRTHDQFAVLSAATDSALVNIDAASAVHGGWGNLASSAASVMLNGSAQTLNNDGLIDALTDRAAVSGSSSGNWQINNHGTITGTINASGPAVTFDNAGQWNLRRFADTDGDLVRDTLAVAVSDFGSSGSNSITNNGVITLLGDNGQASTLDSTGAYSTGYATNNMAIGGAAQAQILNVQTFTNSGTIDMGPGNPAVGDVLVISGSNQPGTNGGGTYVANGGRLILDTVLNEGGANSRSDMLIVDGTQLGSAADKISVINAGGQGALSQADGIELVRVLDKTRSAENVFKLDGSVIVGIYEYDLYQGGVGADVGDGNWYLRVITGSPTPAPAPRTGVYLRNMTAASGMFMHTLHDRLGEPQYTDQYKDESNGKVSSLWVRVVGNHTDSHAANGEIGLNTDTSLVHLGGDLARWSNDGKDRWQFGLMGAYGHSDVDAEAAHHLYTNNGTKRTASGDVDGYSAGAYLTWYGNKDKPTGPYVDLWGLYGWYNNKVQGNGFKEQNYDSTGWTLSAETGYAFIGHDGEKRQWMIEPQAQIAYNNYNADTHWEQETQTLIHNDDAGGVIGRLGARLYSRSKLGDNGMQPFVEANWWYSSAKNSLMFNGDTLSEDTPNSTFELKAGLQGEIAKGWQLWGHIGGRWGANSYSSYEGMVGAKHQF